MGERLKSTLKIEWPVHITLAELEEAITAINLAPGLTPLFYPKAGIVYHPYIKLFVTHETYQSLREELRNNSTDKQYPPEAIERKRFWVARAGISVEIERYDQRYDTDLFGEDKSH